MTKIVLVYEVSVYKKLQCYRNVKVNRVLEKSLLMLVHGDMKILNIFSEEFELIVNDYLTMRKLNVLCFSSVAYRNRR